MFLLYIGCIVGPVNASLAPTPHWFIVAVIGASLHGGASDLLGSSVFRVVIAPFLESAWALVVTIVVVVAVAITIVSSIVLFSLILGNELSGKGQIVLLIFFLGFLHDP